MQLYVEQKSQKLDELLRGGDQSFSDRKGGEAIVRKWVKLLAAIERIDSRVASHDLFEFIFIERAADHQLIQMRLRWTRRLATADEACPYLSVPMAKQLPFCKRGEGRLTRPKTSREAEAKSGH